MTLQDAVAYVTGVAAIAPVLGAAWRHPRIAGLRGRLYRRLATTGADHQSAPTIMTGTMAAELLEYLPRGAMARYESPDGGSLTVWWITSPQEESDRGGVLAVVSGTSRHEGPASEGAFGLRSLSRQEFEQARQRVIRSLMGFGFPQAELAELTDQAILQCLRSGRLDPERDPVPYFKKAARLLACKVAREREEGKGRGAEILTADMAQTCAAHVVEPGTQWDQSRNLEDWGALDDSELIERAQKAVQDIPAPQTQEVVHLRTCEGLPPSEVSEKLGIPRNQVDQPLHRGLRMVRSMPDVEPYIRQAYTKRRAGRRQDGE